MGRDAARSGHRRNSRQQPKEAPMKMLVPSLTLLFLVTTEAQAIKITLFIDTDTFVQRAQDIVVAKCTGPVPDAWNYEDGLYPVDVQIVSVLKGSKKPGKARLATIYP